MKRIFVLTLALAVCAAAAFAQGHDTGAITSPAEMKYGPLPGLPPCAQGAVLHGDPGKGGATLSAKATAGCKIPWHWHTATEQLGIVSGSAKLEIKDGPSKAIGAGAYAYLPAKHTHQFTCTAACTFFIGTDGAFDIHYVDASGKEISLDEALKSKTAAKGAAKAPAKK
ncbi:MAG TPA: cupin domain-containing protein [Terriglobales bacterium]|nr:cupin domain-containing protein [Terriglobales bacterium]